MYVYFQPFIFLFLTYLASSSAYASEFTKQNWKSELETIFYQSMDPTPITYELTMVMMRSDIYEVTHSTCEKQGMLSRYDFKCNLGNRAESKAVLYMNLKGRKVSDALLEANFYPVIHSEGNYRLASALNKKIGISQSEFMDHMEMLFKRYMKGFDSKYLKHSIDSDLNVSVKIKFD